MSVSIGPGWSIGAGWAIGAGASSFTVTSSDISNPTNYYGGYSSLTTSGFTSDGTQLYNGVRYDITDDLFTTAQNAILSANLATNKAWVWNISFATGGNCLARVGVVNSSPRFIVIAPIDQTDTGWQSGGDNGPTLTGTFTFPATFTLYSPSTFIYNANSWC